VNRAITQAIKQSEKKQGPQPPPAIKMVRKDVTNGTQHALAVTDRQIRVKQSAIVKGEYILQKDFDLQTRVKGPLWQPLETLEREPYQSPVTEHVRKQPRDGSARSTRSKKITRTAKGKDAGVLALASVPDAQRGFKVSAKVDAGVTAPLGFLEREAFKKSRVVPGDLARFHSSELVVRESSGRKFISQREWEQIMKEAEHFENKKGGAKEAAGEAKAGTSEGGASAGPDTDAPQARATFLTEDPEAAGAAEAKVKLDKKRPWLNKGGGTWRPRPDMAKMKPKALKVKPKFNPSDYVNKLKKRQAEDAQQRMDALLVGKDPSTDPKLWKLRYKNRDDQATREARAKALRAPPKWNSTVVTQMLEDSIKTEGYKLQALDQLLMDITKGRRANEQSAQQKVVPTREYIHKVRQRISDLREAASFVRKPTWHDDLKSLRVGGTHGTPLDDFLTLVKAIIDEDANIFDDTPD